MNDSTWKGSSCSAAAPPRRRDASPSATRRPPHKGPLHRQRTGPPGVSVLPRRLSGAGARLPRDGGVPEGDAQAGGLGRAAVWRGQGLARPPPLPAARAVAGELRSTLDRGGTESQALAQPDGMGTPPRAGGAPRSLIGRSCRPTPKATPPPRPLSRGGGFSTG